MSEDSVLEFSQNLDDAGTNPRPIPEGMYSCMILGGDQRPLKDTIEVKGQPKDVVKLVLEIQSTTAGDQEVDTPDGPMNIRGMKVFETMFIDGAMWKINRLAKAAGLETTTTRFDLNDLIEKNVDVIIGHRPNKNDPDQVFANIKKILLPGDVSN